MEDGALPVWTGGFIYAMDCPNWDRFRGGSSAPCWVCEMDLLFFDSCQLQGTADGQVSVARNW